jgi:hypothetical protein
MKKRPLFFFQRKFQLIQNVFKNYSNLICSNHDGCFALHSAESTGPASGQVENNATLNFLGSRSGRRLVKSVGGAKRRHKFFVV